MLKNEVILITGGAGSIGSELVKQLCNDNEIHIFDINETALFDLIEELQLEGKKVYGMLGDVRNYEIMEDYFLKKSYPSYIFHCAALKHVTPCEWNPEEAVKTNVFGTYNIIKLAKKLGSKLINISTDKVVNSKSVMGMTKKIGELLVKNAGYISVRFANVLGSRGSVIPIWQKQVDEGKSLTITHPDMERYFMTIQSAVNLVIKATEIGEPNDIIVLNLGDRIKILDLAKKIIEASGKNIPIKEIGIRPGEELIEKLMTEEELSKAIKKENLWIIR